MGAIRRYRIKNPVTKEHDHEWVEEGEIEAWLEANKPGWVWAWQEEGAPIYAFSGPSGGTHGYEADKVRPDEGFKEVLQRVAAQNPSSPVAQAYGDKGIKASKTRDVVKKHFGRKPD